VLAKLPSHEGLGDLVVGYGTNDDAAVLRIAGDQAIAQTVDFFTPIVDDPYIFGAIAAANAVSDIYAMGATPILGLDIAAVPTDVLPLEMLQEILRGGSEKAAEAGFPIAGGHTIIDDVPKYGLAVTGIVSVSKLVRNSTAKAGDAIVLTKPIGNGILISAFRALSERRFRRSAVPQLDEAIQWMMMLNRDAAGAMIDIGVNAATDVTGYGLIGHLSNIKGGADVELGAVPFMPGVRGLAERDLFPDGSRRNHAAYRDQVDWGGIAEIDQMMLCDAQTSGGLLVAIPPLSAAAFEDALRSEPCRPALIGTITGRNSIRVR
jgi:selenide,water dikinase